MPEDPRIQPTNEQIAPNNAVKAAICPNSLMLSTTTSLNTKSTIPLFEAAKESPADLTT